MYVYAAIFLVTALVAWLTTPLARRLALRWGIVDQPDVRKMHRVPVPYLGGVGVAAGLVAGLVTLLLLARNPQASWAKVDPRMVAIVVGAVVMFGLGLWDDIKHVRVRYKLLAQVVVAIGMWAVGIRIEELRLTEGLVLDFGVFALPITVLWIVAVTNAINLIDGLDGLAAGIGAISAAAIGFVAFQAHHYPTACILVVLSASLIGFLPHNRHPARIFLGDSGSLMIGFVLATSSVTTASKSAAFVSVAAPFIALGLPLLDMCFAVARRWIERRGLFSADRNHIHHRLLALGYSHGRTVLILWAETAVMTGLALVMLYNGTENWQRLTAFAIVLAGHVWFFRATGAVRLRESYRAFQHALARLRASNRRQHCFDELDLRFRSVRSLEDLWPALELAAERLGLSALRFRMAVGNDGGRDLMWRSPQPVSGTMLHATLPIRMAREGTTATLDVEAPAVSVEAFGQMLEVFGKLLDSHRSELRSQPPPRVPIDSRRRSSAVS